MSNPYLSTLRPVVKQLHQLAQMHLDDVQWLDQTAPLLRALLNDGHGLPDSHKQSHPLYYQQHALYIDPQQRFSVSSFVWGPNQGTPIHNHTIAGWVGVLQGAELCQRYSEDGRVRIGDEQRLNAGDISAVCPHQATIGDTHTVRNAFDDRISISIHLYRGNISNTPRSVFKDGVEKPFMSHYSQVSALNLGDMSIS